MNEIMAGNPDLMRGPTLRDWHERIIQGGEMALGAALEIVETFAGVSGVAAVGLLLLDWAFRGG